jgi:cyclophilin family peptidyl-prolyl cis-trans isomerase
MATPNSRRQRELARQQARISAAADSHERTRRRQRLAAGIVAAVAVVAGFGVYIGSTRTADSPSTPTTTEFPSGPTSSVLPNSGITPPAVAPGATLTGATPCPAEDGSSPRTTSFAEAPPMCIDTTHFYTAVISTTKGDIKLQLDAGRTPTTVNDFVVLSRYHFYDGQPVTSITNRKAFTVGMSFTGATTMFDIANEIAPAGQIFTPGAIAMVGTGGVGSPSKGKFLIATFELAADLDDSNTAFGTMLDGFDTLLAINSLGSRSGQPTAVVTITGITITQGGLIPR